MCGSKIDIQFLKYVIFTFSKLVFLVGVTLLHDLDTIFFFFFCKVTKYESFWW